MSTSSVMRISDAVKTPKIENNPARHIIPCNTRIRSDDDQIAFDIKLQHIEGNPGYCHFDIITDDNKDFYKDTDDTTGTKYNVPCNALISVKNNVIISNNGRSELCPLIISSIPTIFSPSMTPSGINNNINFRNYEFKKNIFLKCPNDHTGFIQNNTYTNEAINICLEDCKDGRPFSLNSNYEPRCEYRPSGSFEVD